MPDWYPFLVLAVGIAIVLGGIVALRVHAFLSLIAAAMVVSFMAPGAWDDKVPRVVQAFGATAASVGVVIALAAIIGKAMAESGAADRVVRMFLDVLGEKRGATALMASGFTLGIPVFFDTVFYLLVPLARSMSRRTGGHYVKYLVACAAAASAHALVPPTPGPLAIAGMLDVPLGTMMLVGIAVAAPASALSLLFANWCDRRMSVEPPDVIEHDDTQAATVLADDQLPSLGWAVAPIVLPIVLITAKAIVDAVEAELPSPLGETLTVLGNPNLALLAAAVVALAMQRRFRRHSLRQMAASVEHALMSGGVIVLITAAGGAFGEMLRRAQLAPAIRAAFGETAASGLGLLLLAFGIASLIKFAQGSSTTAMITTAGMVSAMLNIAGPDETMQIDVGLLGFHPVYVATAIGGGSLVGSWMNDSGFWIFAKMGGLTEVQTLKTWSPQLAILGLISMAMTLLLATVLPMAPGG